MTQCTGLHPAADSLPTASGESVPTEVRRGGAIGRQNPDGKNALE